MIQFLSSAFSLQSKYLLRISSAFNLQSKPLVPLSILLFLPALCFATPTYPDIRASYTASDAVLLDRHGEVIHELRVDPRGRRLAWVKLADMSPALIKAVIRSEDKRFFEHHGADWKALTSAAFGSVFGNAKRGASTITMQLASMLDDHARSKKGKRTISQKWDQIKAARNLERAWTKDQILEAYLNLVSFRGELQGIGAASRGIFDKDPGGLDETESAILGALIRSPNATPGRTGERAAVLAHAAFGNSVQAEMVEHRARERLSGPSGVQRRIDCAPQVAQKLLHRGDQSVASTLDASLQRAAIEALRKAVTDLSGQNAQDGAVLVVDNRSGDVLAYVANAGELSSAPHVDGILARRQAGSTLKPFLYGLAIEQGVLTAASLIDDAPLDIPTDRGVYRPENYDKEFRGAVTARTALASSLNIPAVKVLGLVGTDNFISLLRSLGFTGLSEAEHYGPSLALGSADISVWELVNAYRVLANRGMGSSPHLVQQKRSAQHRIISPQAAFIVSDILSDREARSATFSLENPLSTRYWTAVKTGTSKDMRDNWCVGFSDRYTVGVWVGNFSGAAMWNVSGVSGAAPVWLEMMNTLHRSSSSTAPAVPPGIVRKAALVGERGSASARQEWFIIGREGDTARGIAAERTPKITYPAAGTIIAKDPDIPTDVQRMFFSVSHSVPTLRLVLDDAEIGSGPVVVWQLVVGAHRLALVDPKGIIIDRITFEVR